MTQLFKTIPGFPNYEAGSLGTIRRKDSQRVLTPFLVGRALYVTLTPASAPEQKTRSVARCVLMAHRPSNSPPADVHAAHRDKNPKNNQLANLYWKPNPSAPTKVKAKVRYAPHN